MHQYPSDISREEYKLIREDLEGAKKTTRPRKYDLYDVFCAVLYVIQGGIQWRMLPGDYPKWQSVYYHFRVWSETVLFYSICVMLYCAVPVSCYAGKRRRMVSLPFSYCASAVPPMLWHRERAMDSPSPVEPRPFSTV